MPICDPGERVDETGLAYKGSMLQLQIYVNRFTDRINLAVAKTLRSSAEINWVSPLAATGYAEYRDKSFLTALGLERHTPELADFWPGRGPCWDGLGLISEGFGPEPLLVEAKSYPQEGYSTMAAKSSESVRRIEEALDVTAVWLGLNERPPSWTHGRYQVANRLAHLYFLREVVGVEAHVIFAFFVRDPTHISTELREWERATEIMWVELGMSDPPDHTGVVYLDGVRHNPNQGI